MNANDANRFFNGTGSAKACSHCGASDWAYVEPDQAYATWGLPLTWAEGAPKEAARQNQAIPALVFACTSCAKLQLFAELVAAQWLKDNPEG